MDIFSNTIIRQIGRANVMAISGFRVNWANDRAVSLPVSHGYRVIVTLDEATDTYNVERVFCRGGKQFGKGFVDGVYADQLGETAYRASCFRNVEFGQ